MPANCCIALHDVAPATWPQCQSLIRLIQDKLGSDTLLTLLITPRYHHLSPATSEPDFQKAIDQRIACGDSLALHGLYHLDEQPRTLNRPFDYLKRTIYTAGEGEFATLTYTQAQEKIAQGLHDFTQLGWQAEGFIAPAWLLSPESHKALTGHSFHYTSTKNALIDLATGAHHPTTTLVASSRASWRRTLSIYYNHQLLQKHQKDIKVQRTLERPLRITLHPAEANHPKIMELWQKTFIQIRDDFSFITKKQAVERLRNEKN